jgi:hypothetical protein
MVILVLSGEVAEADTAVNKSSGCSLFEDVSSVILVLAILF